MFFFLQEAQQTPASGLITMVPMIFFFLFFMYLLVIRPQRREEKKKIEMINNLQKGDKVITIGGVIGKISKIQDDEYELQVDDTTKTKITFQRYAIRSLYKKASNEQENKDKDNGK
jgi:preprotein translocase subunit YajC